jgi:hypothetical protein
MSAALLLKLGELLLQLGPAFVSEVEAVRAAGTASTADMAALNAQIETMDAQRMASWGAADAALDDASGQ